MCPKILVLITVIKSGVFLKVHITNLYKSGFIILIYDCLYNYFVIIPNEKLVKVNSIWAQFWRENEFHVIVK